MQYMLMIYSDQSRIQAMAPEDGQKMMAAFNAYTESLKAAGAYVGGDRLQPTSTGATVRVRDGQTQVLDGPYADTKEQLGGYYLIEAADLDEAVKWAARCPGAAVGTLEVRPVWAM
ncbi:MAG: YciI family protein [Proteobacteria bacterium]|nr:YciI family protein [Pseudomonadota bacterium]